MADRSYRMKHELYPVGMGYGEKRPPADISTIVIHTTGGRKGSLFEQELNFLLHSRRVSAHFLIGKEGQVAQILPIDFIAWHTGPTINDKQYGNAVSVGIECHLTFGESWTTKMHNALTELCKRLVRELDIKYIVTHRKIAPGRKIDPLYWSDDSFEAWANDLLMIKQNISILGKTKDKLSYIINLVKQRSTNKKIDEIITEYYAAGSLTGLNANLAIAQAVHETGWFNSFWCLEHNNMAGIGVTGEQSIYKPIDTTYWVYDAAQAMWIRGNKFNTVKEGVIAHCGRMLAYALKDEETTVIQKEYIDVALKHRPLRSDFRGIAKTIADFSTRWAPSPIYHERIIRIYRMLTDEY